MIYIPAKRVLALVPLLMILVVALLPAGGYDQARAQSGPRIKGPFVGAIAFPAVSPEVRGLPIAPLVETGDRTGEVNPRVGGDDSLADVEERVGPDPLIPEPVRTESARTPAPALSFDGIPYTGVVPPDPVGDVGPNHYVQMVNSGLGAHFAVYDKAGSLLIGPTSLSSLWAGEGNHCEFLGAGDPIVLYDLLADRWLMSQFTGSDRMCIAISQTPDPGAAYFLYDFAVPVFPDYFKFGVWPDAYYMSANEGTAAVGVFAFDRANMLAGVDANFQRFQAQANFMLPSDLDGPNPPPAGSPNLFYTMMDDVIWPIIGIPGPDRLEVYEFHVDFTNPPNSTFTLADTLLTAPFIYTVCGYFNFNCITQPGTGQRVDAVSEWPMWRLQYRNFGTHETLVGNFSVDVDGTDHAAIRWFELRRSGGSWSILQEGTHSPDSDNRFMGSAAMDGDGNIALGYSVSSGSTFPSLRYATRVPGDPPGTLQPEASLVAGGGSQTGSNRWGDYSAMSVDPADDCTFWYTGEYQQATAPVNWRTALAGAFVLPSCSGASTWERPLGNQGGFP